MSDSKVTRKELTAKIVDKIHEALGEINENTSKKIKKSAETVARKLAKKFNASLKKAEKKAKNASAAKVKDSKKSKKQKKAKKVVAAQPVKLAAPAENQEVVAVEVKQKKEAVTASMDGQE